MSETVSAELTRFVYDQGFEDALLAVAQAIDAELTDLSKYGRTELYGLHKTKTLILKLSLNQPTQTNADKSGN